MTRNVNLILAMAATAAIAAAQAPQPKMGAPLSGLTAAQQASFDAGRDDFGHTLQESEGLGPIFNQNSCASCHNNPFGGTGTITVTRFGLWDPKGVGWDPLAALGGSLLQANAIAPPALEVVPPQANTTALRVTTSTLGLGLLEAIPDADLLFYVNNPPSPNVSGRAHMVTPLETPAGPTRVGRFGWKAQVATVLSFSGDAALNEMGFTNRLVPTENAPNGNQALLALYDLIPDPEDGPDGQGLHFIDRITSFQRLLAPPPQTPRSGMTGEQLFTTVGCTDCHVATYTTSNDPSLESVLRNKQVRPYSDFLLHDMGVNADFIGQGGADLQELRTPPLWGVRVRDPMWHDGRVSGGTLESRMLGAGGVIDQHAGFGSESLASANAFQALSQPDQLAVVAFLDSLGKREFDSNGDDVLDRLDVPAFCNAFNGGPYTPDDPESVFDFDQDTDVDIDDWDVLAAVYDEDCNQNGVSDLLDIKFGTSLDVNTNYVPDECDHCQTDLGYEGGGSILISICGDDLRQPNSTSALRLTGATPGSPLFLFGAFTATPTQLLPNLWIVPTQAPLFLAGLGVADPTGEFVLTTVGVGGANTATWVVQAAGFHGLVPDTSNGLSVLIGY